MVNAPQQVVYVIKIGLDRLVIIIIEKLVMEIDFTILYKIIVNAIKVLLEEIIVRLSFVIMIVLEKEFVIRILELVIVKLDMKGLIVLYFPLIFSLFDWLLLFILLCFSN